MLDVQRRASGALHDRPAADPGDLCLPLLGRQDEEMNWGVHWDVRIAAVILAITLTVAIAFFLYLLS